MEILTSTIKQLYSSSIEHQKELGSVNGSTLKAPTLNKSMAFTIIGMCLTLFFFSSSSYAQDNMVDAFRESYALEKYGDFRAAVQKLKNVYQVESYELNLRLGWLTYQAGSINESIDYYNNAIRLMPYSIEPKFGLIFPYSAQGKWDEIITLYKRILETDSQNTLANYRLGLIYYNRKNYEKAELYVEKVVNLYPFDYDSLILLAWIKLNLQKTREAKVLFQKVLLNSPGDESAKEGLSLMK